VGGTAALRWWRAGFPCLSPPTEPGRTQTKDTAGVGLVLVRQITGISAFDSMIGAAAAMMGLPLILLLMFMQRQFVRGLTAGALKEV